MFSVSRGDEVDFFVENGSGSIKVHNLKELYKAIFASLNEKHYVVISNELKQIDLKSYTSKHHLIENDFIFLNYSIRKKFKSLDQDVENPTLAQVVQMIQKLV